MSAKPIYKPGPQHPITMEPIGSHVAAEAGGVIVAESDNALRLKEASYPAVIYVPRSDAKMDLLRRSDHTSYCPFKGDASYFDIPAGGERAKNAVWTYEAPHEAVAAIKDHLAFYPDRVDAIRQS
jgi:uncharacterized protein (DUF427 family)